MSEFKPMWASKKRNIYKKVKNLGIFFKKSIKVSLTTICLLFYIYYFLKIEKSIIKRILEKLSHKLIKENLGWYDI